MLNNFENFDNSETSARKSSLIQERVGLVSTHMYKQFLDYQHATINTNEIFVRMIDNLQSVSEALRQSFSSRGITAENIYVNTDEKKSVAVINILWHEISFTTRCNYQPQALYRENGEHLFCDRIMAIRGNYNKIMQNVKDHDEEMGRLLENEVASLYIPAEQNQNSILKIKHLSNREFYLNQVDAPREFVLKVIEYVCGGGFYHEEGARKQFNI